MFYKYCSTKGKGIENLEKKSICFSDIDMFNDPFEGIGEYLYEVSSEEREYFKSIGSDIPGAAVKWMGENFRKTVKFKQRVWCATETCVNDLMWAHYANSHKGFCVGYTEENIRRACDRFEKIVYLQKPTAVDIRANTDMSAIEGLLFQKGASWEYEKEWRALYTLQPEDVEHLEPFENFQKCFINDSHYLYTPHKILCGVPSDENIYHRLEVLRSPRRILRECPPSEIYLGLRISRDDENEIIQICKDQKIPAFRMVQRPGSFELETECIFDPR